MARQTPSLSQGAERLSKLARNAPARQHELSASNDLHAPPQSPGDAWARKYLSEGFGPGAPASPAMPATEQPTAARQAQFMRELKTRAGEKGNHAQSYGKMAMQKPFSPKGQPKRSIWSRMTRGS